MIRTACAAGTGRPGVGGGSHLRGEPEVLGGLGQVLREVGGDLLGVHHSGAVLVETVAVGGVGDGAGVDLGAPPQPVDAAVGQGRRESSRTRAAVARMASSRSAVVSGSSGAVRPGRRVRRDGSGRARGSRRGPGTRPPWSRRSCRPPGTAARSARRGGPGRVAGRWVRRHSSGACHCQTTWAV